MLKVLDELVFKGLHLGLLGFLLYGGLVYAPESPATLLLGFIASIVALWFIGEITFKLNELRVDKKINRYYR